MQLTLFLFGREVLSLSLDLPETPAFSSILSEVVPQPIEVAVGDEEEDEDWEEEGKRKVKFGLRQQNDR
jgi:hypothetical protein